MWRSQGVTWGHLEQLASCEPPERSSPAPAQWQPESEDSSQCHPCLRSLLFPGFRANVLVPPVPVVAVTLAVSSDEPGVGQGQWGCLGFRSLSVPWRVPPRPAGMQLSAVAWAPRAPWPPGIQVNVPKGFSLQSGALLEDPASAPAALAVPPCSSLVG